MITFNPDLEELSIDAIDAKALIGNTIRDISISSIQRVALRDGYAYITDGHRATRCKVSSDTGATAMDFDLDTFTRALKAVKMKGGKLVCGRERITAFNDYLLVGTFALPACVGEFPLNQARFDEFLRSRAKITSATIGINPAYVAGLALVCKADGVEGLMFEFRAKTDPVYYYGIDWSGIIMPMNL